MPGVSYLLLMTAGLLIYSFGLHLLENKGGEWADILANGGGFKRLHVLLPPDKAYDGPGITAGSEKRVHEEAPDAPVSIGVRVDIDED